MAGISVKYWLCKHKGRNDVFDDKCEQELVTLTFGTHFDLLESLLGPSHLTDNHEVLVFLVASFQFIFVAFTGTKFTTVGRQ